MIAFKLNLCGLSIGKIEKQCKKFPLENERDYSDCLFSYKLLNGTVHCLELLSLIGFRTPPVNTRHNAIFYIKSIKRNFVAHSFKMYPYNFE